MSEVKLSYTFSSINKNLLLDIPNRFYNAEEVKDFLRDILKTLDHYLKNHKESEKENG